MKTADIATAIMGLIFGAIFAFGYMAIVDNHLSDLDAQRGVEGAIYELVK